MIATKAYRVTTDLRQQRIPKDQSPYNTLKDCIKGQSESQQDARKSSSAQVHSFNNE
jgi:hypothetical protein